MIVVSRNRRIFSLAQARAPLELLIFAGYILIHLVCLRSLLEAHFSSTVVREVLPLQWSSQADARRLVLFVSDGLRADKFFELDENQLSRAPFLRNVIANEGSWGVSHTKAPTESRSAHTAMLAGFYEDPSTIRALFRSNPVEFDTVFNESRETWSYGAYDVIPFFNKGTAADHVHVSSHRYNVRKYADVDKWAFDMLQKLFDEAESRTRLQRDKIIFFLHLAGVDSNGHAFHPGSKQYLDNIREVDDIVKRTVDLVESYFGFDNKTAYIFTGDHGMTDSGVHGGGSHDETRTPFIAWGNGINKARMQHHEIQFKPSEITETKKWGLDPTTRHDIQQIDVSVFMASLIGVPFPVNSEGKLPLAYLSKGRPTAEKCYRRVQQLLKTLQTKKNKIKERDFHILFWHYQTNENAMIVDMLRDIEQSIEAEQYDAAIEKSSNLTDFAIKALAYYHFFSNHMLLLCTVLSITGWVVIAILKFLSSGNICMIQNDIPSLQYIACVMVLLIAILLRLYSFHPTWIYYIYVAVPIHIWAFLIPQITKLLKSISYITCYSKYFLGHGIAVTLWLSFIIQGFYDRAYFTPVVIGLTGVFPVSNGFKISKTVILWVFLCFSLSIFPLLPDIISQSVSRPLIILAGVCGQLYCILIAKYHGIFGSNPKLIKGRITYVIVRISVFFPSLVMTLMAVTHVNETVAMTVLIAGWVFPFFCSPDLFQRLTVINSLHVAIYLLLSESHDAIFFIVFTALLHLWAVIATEESYYDDVTIGITGNGHSKHQTGERCGRVRDDLRAVCIFISFLAMSFFSLYSISSLNHFHQRNVPFVSISSSFHLLLVFIYKLLLRLFAPAIAYCTVLKRNNLSVTSHWYLLSALFDVIFLFFYLTVRTSGSWVEIGLSVVNVCVSFGIPVATALLFLISKTIVGAHIPV